MEKMERIRSMLCRELDDIADKGELSAGDLQSIHMLTDTIKNIDKIEMLEDGEYSNGYAMAYSRDGGWNASGTYSRGDRDRYSGARHYVRGHYSRDDGTDMMMRRIDEMMGEGNLSNTEKDALRRARDILTK